MPVGRPKGYPKTGGRQAGTPNKAPKLSALLAVLKEFDYDAARRLMTLEPELPPFQRVGIALKLLEYQYPLKENEEQGDDAQQDTPAKEMPTEQLLRIVHPEPNGKSNGRTGKG